MSNLAVILEKLDTLNPLYHEEISHTPVDENELIEFEKRHNICLPKEYRTFLHVVGTGFFVMSHEEIGRYQPNWLNALSSPFPYSKPRPEENGEELDLSGIIHFHHAGCGMAYFIVVSGQEYGNIWLDDTPNCNGVAPMPFPFNNFGDPEIERIRQENKARMSFYQWLEAKLDKMIASSRYYQQYGHLLKRPPPSDSDVPF
jgi:hypothetical protein